MYSDFLSSLPDKAARDPKVTIEQCAALHPTLGLESYETWTLFLHLRPDIVGQDRKDIQAIIKRLLDNDNHEYGAAVAKWKEEDENKNKIDA